jgi:hypothetical protein
VIAFQLTSRSYRSRLYLHRRHEEFGWRRLLLGEHAQKIYFMILGDVLAQVLALTNESFPSDDES